LAGVVLGATLVAAAWLYSYETWQTIEVFDRFGKVVASTRVRSQPWWSVYAALALAVAGTGFSVWLVPESRRLMRRSVSRLTARFSAKPLY
jgi:membrane protein YdbS with pleckstrin-like domain